MLLAANMKSSIALFLALGQALAQTPIRVITFNIRYDNTDISLGSGEVYWLNAACAEEPALCRAPGVVNTLRKENIPPPLDAKSQERAIDMFQFN